jgi:hypothetical protein
MREVRMAHPPDLAAIDIGHSLLVQTPFDAGLGRTPLEVGASPPAALDRPEIGQSA